MKFVTVALLSSIFAVEAFGGPVVCGTFYANCSPKTLRYNLDSADFAVIARAGEELGDSAGKTRGQVFEVIRSLKGKQYRLGKMVSSRNHTLIKLGEFVMLYGTTSASIQTVKVTERAIEYMLSAPDSDSSKSTWLTYYLPKLTSNDRVIREDAYRACEYLDLIGLELADLIASKDSIPANAITEELSQIDSIDSRIDFLGLLVGVAGDDEDARLVKNILRDDANIETVIPTNTLTGLVLLTGTDGLDWIDAQYLSHFEDRPLSQAISDQVWAIQQAIRKIWELTKTDYDVPVSRERFGRSLLRILACPQLANSALADLIKLRDWTHVERVYSLYAVPHEQSPSCKQFAFQYLVYASRSDTHDWIDGPAAKAAEYLVMLEDKDAKSFRSMMKDVSLDYDESGFDITFEPKR